jgi:hypothetical protein
VAGLRLSFAAAIDDNGFKEANTAAHDAGGWGSVQIESTETSGIPSSLTLPPSLSLLRTEAFVESDALS